jgi:hypothetical protein
MKGSSKIYTAVGVIIQYDQFSTCFKSLQEKKIKAVEKRSWVYIS